MTLFRSAHPSWLHRNLVVIVASFSFLMMTLLVVQQERVIEAQRNLIHQLFGDSMQLSGLRMQRSVRPPQQPKHTPATELK